MSRFRFIRAGALIVPAWITPANVPAKPPAWNGVQPADVNPSNFDTVLANVSDGSPVTLFAAPGNYGAKTISKRATANIRIAAADINDQPRMVQTDPTYPALTILGAANITFDGWRFEAENTARPYYTKVVETGKNGAFTNDNIRITRSTFKGANDPTYNVGLGYGIMIRAANGFSVDRCKFQKVTYGVSLSYDTPINTNVYVGFNDWSLGNGQAGVHVDSMNIYGVDTCIIEWNYEWNKFWIAGDLHPDSYQFGEFSLTHGHDERSRNVWMRNNLSLWDHNSVWTDGSPLYGQFMWLSDAETTGFSRFLIENNIALFPGYHAIALQVPMDRAIVRNNRLYESNHTSYGMEAWLEFADVNWAVLQTEVAFLDNIASRLQYANQPLLVKPIIKRNKLKIPDGISNVISEAQAYAIRDEWLRQRSLLY